MNTTQVDWNRREFGVLEPATAAWDRVKQDLGGVWLPIVVGVLIMAFTQGVFSGVRATIEAVAQESQNPDALNAMAGLVGLMGNVASALVTAFLGPGIILFCLKVWRGQPHAMGDIFSGGRYFGWTLLLNFLSGLAVGIGCCLLIFPGVYLALSFALAPALVVDRNLNSIDALKESYRIMDGLRGTLFGFWVVFGLLSLLFVVVTCGLGGLLIGPVSWLASVYIYLKATGDRAGTPVDATVFS